MPTLPVTVGPHTILLHLDSTDDPPAGPKNFELWRAQTYATKEPDTLAWIDAFFRPGDTFYDIGANIGQYSLYAAKTLAGQCQIFAFEPEALNFAKLNRNIALNHFTGTIIPYPLALSDRTALDRFFSKTFAPAAALHALHHPMTQGDESFAPQNQQGIMAVSLDDLTMRFALPAPTHIKIDVDGIEADIIRGAPLTLANPALRSALVEVYIHKSIAEEIQSNFERHGFALHNPSAAGWKPGTAQNLIFTRS